jgi:hypothetical protein
MVHISRFPVKNHQISLKITNFRDFIMTGRPINREILSRFYRHFFLDCFNRKNMAKYIKTLIFVPLSSVTLIPMPTAAFSSAFRIFFVRYLTFVFFPALLLDRALRFQKKWNRKPNRNRSFSGTAGTEIFLNGNKETIQVERNLKRQQLMISTSVCSEYFLRWHI